MSRFTLRELESIARNPKKWNASKKEVSHIKRYLKGPEAKARRARAKNRVSNPWGIPRGAFGIR